MSRVVLVHFVALIVIVITRISGQQDKEKSSFSYKEMLLTNVMACTAIMNAECQEEFENCMSKIAPNIREYVSSCSGKLNNNNKKYSKYSKNRRVFMRLCADTSNNGAPKGDANNTLRCLCNKLEKHDLRKVRDEMNVRYKELSIKTLSSDYGFLYYGCNYYVTRSTDTSCTKNEIA